MNFFRHIFVIIRSAVLCLVMCIGSVSGFEAVAPTYEAAYGNPLKGFVPFYTEDGSGNEVPHSMEFFYIPLSALMSDDGEYTIREGLEPYLTKIASRSHQAIFRVYLDYPAKSEPDAVPRFIKDAGVKMIPYTDLGGGVSPDYTDDKLIDILENFVRELGKEYDGDTRIAYITAGLIGHWGEWHCYACPEAMATEDGQRRIANAFRESFPNTHVLMRYPGTPGTENGDFGFHDDSFTFETLGDKSKSWYYFNRLKKAAQTDIWKTRPVGGEFRPEGQADFLDGKQSEEYQNFDECIGKTHCSWLMMNGAFQKNMSDKQIKNACDASVKTGYDLTVTKAGVRRTFGKTTVWAAVKNVGSAPLYVDAKPLFKVGDDEFSAEGDSLDSLLPGETFIYTAEISPQTGDEISVRIASDKTLAPICFSNKGGCDSEDGSLLLGKIK